MDAYPKSREELQSDNAKLEDKVREVEQHARMLETTLRNKESEIAMLRRRKPPHTLSPDAVDKFSRPARR